METSNALVQRQRPHDVSIPPSSPSDTALVSDAGGDPLQIISARGDPEPSTDVVNQELRDEIAQLRQSYHQEVHASQFEESGIIHSFQQSSMACDALAK